MKELSRAAETKMDRKCWGPQQLADGTRFRLWAPGEKRVAVKLGGRDHLMERGSDGWFELSVSGAKPGDEYAFVLDNGKTVPDPASRQQKADVHGASLIAACAYDWTDDAWTGRAWEEAVISEIHIGTFTNGGTFAAAAQKLHHLAEAGITAIEVMPVAHFAGNRGWGYDGVLHYAPHPAYGTPEDFKAFVDTAHAHGIMVLLDVVYNHFGPEGNYLHEYAPDFFRNDRETPWGAAIDFGQEAVRRYFIDNALYWLEEFRLDGLRLDAVEQIHDTSERHVLDELACEVHSAFADRHVHLVVEDQRNLVSLLARDETGKAKAYTAEWNDDYHHVAHIIATGETIGHYKAFGDDLWEKTKLALQHGFVYPDRSDPPELPTDGFDYLPPEAFINFLQNHDQIGNRAFGERLVSLAEPDIVEALTAITLLSPQIPFLFMGEEYGETQPFYFFCDYSGELGDIIRKGRSAEAEGFGGLKEGKSLDDLPDPNAISTFEGSILQWGRAESEDGKRSMDLVVKLTQLRQQHIVPLLKQPGRMHAASIAAGEGILAIDWTFEGARLQLRANLTQSPSPVPNFDGQVIFEQRAGPGLQNPDREATPWSVIFAIAR